MVGRASRNKFPSDANGRDGRFINQKRTSGHIFKFGLRIADFILSRIRSLSAAKPSHFYQGLAEWQVAGQPQWPFIKFYQGRPAYGRFINNGRFFKIDAQASGRNGRFINQKRANGQICRFGLRMVDFILSRTSSLSTARSSLFRKSWQSQWPLYQTGQLSQPLRKLLQSSSRSFLYIFF